MWQRLLLLAGLALLLADEARAQSDTARITVRLPAEARLYVDDVLSPQRSAVHSFDTPRLEPGRKYTYTLRAELVVDGKTLTLSKKATFTRGDTVEVEFGDRAAFVAAATPGTGPALPAPTPSDSRPLRVKGAPPRPLAVFPGKDGTLDYKEVLTEYVEETVKVKVKGPDGEETEVDRKQIKPVYKEVTRTFDPKTTTMSRADGAKVPASDWQNVIKERTLVLVSRDGGMLDPFYLKFLKDDVLIVVPEAPSSPIIGDGMRVGLARLQPDGQLYLRILSGEGPRQVDADVIVRGTDQNTPVTTVQKMRMTRATTTETEAWLDAGAVEAVDADGKATPARDLAKRLADETPVVMFVGPYKPDPQLMNLFKKGTVILHVPVTLFGGHFEGPAMPTPKPPG